MGKHDPEKPGKFVSISSHNGSKVAVDEAGKVWRFDDSKGRWVPDKHEWKPGA